MLQIFFNLLMATKKIIGIPSSCPQKFWSSPLSLPKILRIPQKSSAPLSSAQCKCKSLLCHLQQHLFKKKTVNTSYPDDYFSFVVNAKRQVCVLCLNRYVSKGGCLKEKSRYRETKSFSKCFFFSIGSLVKRAISFAPVKVKYEK